MEAIKTTPPTAGEMWEAIRQDPVFKERTWSEEARDFIARTVIKMHGKLIEQADMPVTTKDLAALKHEVETHMVLARIKRLVFQELGGSIMSGQGATGFINRVVGALNRSHSQTGRSADESPPEQAIIAEPPAEPTPEEAILLELNADARAAHDAGTLTIGSLMRLHPSFFLPWLLPPKKAETKSDAPTP